MPRLLYGSDEEQQTQQFHEIPSHHTVKRYLAWYTDCIHLAESEQTRLFQAIKHCQGQVISDQLETVPLNALDGFDGLAHCHLQSVQSVTCLHLSPSKTIPFVLKSYAQSERRIGVDLTDLAVRFHWRARREFASVFGTFKVLLLGVQLTARIILWLQQCSLW
jgi:hypothetical protein